MDEERIAVLRMVAENKITADEAAQLLDALKEQESEAYANDTKPSNGEHYQTLRRRAKELHRQAGEMHRRAAEMHRQERDRHRQERHQHRQHRWQERHRERDRRRTERQAHWQEKLNDLSGLFEDMFGEGGLFGKQGAFAGFCAGAGGKGEQNLTIPEGTEVHLTGAAGNLTVQGTDGDRLRLLVEETGRFPRIAGPQVHQDPEGKRVKITTTGQNLTIEAPWQMTALHTNISGGNLFLSDLSADLHLNVTGGNLAVQDTTGFLSAKVVGGQAEMTGIRSNEVVVRIEGGSASVGMDAITEGKVVIRAMNGNISLRLPSASAFEVEARTTQGQIRANIDGETDDKDGEWFRATHNDGGAMVALVTQMGDIDLEVTDAAATERIDDEGSHDDHE